MPGFTFYAGPSMLDGAPIVGIAITQSTNRKTGDIVQTYIIRSDVHPVEALKTGQDGSVCGVGEHGCKHRPIVGGACYVNVGQGVAAVYKAFTRGNYPADVDAAALACADKTVRLGTYGDPAAIPADAWVSLLAHASGTTGYTHQWQNTELTDDQLATITSLCMASVDTLAERAIAKAAGLRTFRIRVNADDALQAGEFACPASAEAGYRKTCAACKACDGTSRAGQASPAIIVHGAKATRFRKVIELMSV